METLCAKVNSTLGLISIKDFYKPSYGDKIKILDTIKLNRSIYYPAYWYNFPLYEDPDKYFESLYHKFMATSVEIFGPLTVSPNSRSTCWCLYSTEDSWAVEFHDHVKTSTINAVFYLDLNDGDSISFMDSENNEHVYYPEEGELLIFPNFLLHTPNKPVSFDKVRCSINMEITVEEDSDKLFSPFLK